MVGVPRKVLSKLVTRGAQYITRPKHGFENIRSRNPPDHHVFALVLKHKYTREIIMLTDSFTLEELNRSQTFSLTTATPNVG